MNDRFKFRVWSEEDCGYMESNDIFRLTHSGKLVFNNDTLNREPECNPKRYICEQCTGLKDKNGKLIYEGDIVETQGIKKIVKYNQSSCCFVFHNIGTIISHHIEDSWLNEFPTEIIGNIHQNPELVEKSDAHS